MAGSRSTARVNIRYSTGSLSPLIKNTGEYLDGTTWKAYRGTRSIGGLMATAAPTHFPKDSTTFEIAPAAAVGVNYIWSDITREENYAETWEYRLLYLYINKGKVYDPAIYFSGTSYATYQILPADTKNTSCTIVLPNENTAPVDPNATSGWHTADQASATTPLYLMPMGSSMKEEDFIYFWVRRRGTKNIVTGNKVTDKFSITVRADE